jgi:thiamine transport system substrate-binding protein
MKKILLMLIAVFSCSTIVFGADKKTLTIYTYESLGWISGKIVPEFEKRNNCTVKIVKFADAGNILARIRLEKKRPTADCVLGLTQPLVILAKKNSLISPYRSKNLSRVSRPELLFDSEYATPFDYGSLAFVYLPDKIKGEPRSFADFKILKKSIILEDPRASSTGQDFLLWTIAVYGKDWKDFWKGFKPSVLTVAPGWGEAFAKFEAGEAPVMLSYATDGAYAWHNYKSTKYRACIPSEGGFIQVETACVINGSKNKELAEKFSDYILEDSVQAEIPLNQWMFPAVRTVMPEAFKYAINPVKVKTLSEQEISNNLETWIKEWEDLFR